MQNLPMKGRNELFRGKNGWAPHSRQRGRRAPRDEEEAASLPSSPESCWASCVQTGLVTKRLHIECCSCNARRHSGLSRFVASNSKQASQFVFQSLPQGTGVRFVSCGVYNRIRYSGPLRCEIHLADPHLFHRAMSRDDTKGFTMLRTYLVYIGMLLVVGCGAQVSATSDEQKLNKNTSQASPADIKDCEESFAFAEDSCTEISQKRECFFQEYRKLCTTGNPTAITDSMQCFAESTGCHTFADPGGDELSKCLGLSYEKHATEATRKLFEAMCEKCPNDRGICGPNGATGVPATHLSPESVASMNACVELASTCGEVSECVEIPIHEAAACFNKENNAFLPLLIK